MTVSSETLRSISAPDKLESRLGTLEFVNDVPRSETVETVYDHLDFVHALNVYHNGVCGRLDIRAPQGLPGGGSSLQPDPHVLGVDGLGIAVSDRERRHGLLHRHCGSHVGADGRRDASPVAGNLR